MNHVKLKRNLRDYACIAYSNDGLVYSSKKRGIAPLVELCELNTNRYELHVGDKVIGKAAALLCLLCNVKVLYAKVISVPALKLLEQNDVDVQYSSLVPYIMNRAEDGKCPMEALSADTDSPEEMLRRAKEFLQNI